MNILKFAAVIVAGYLLGSLSASIFLSRTAWGGDVRGKGSGNAGATNLARVYGGICAMSGHCFPVFHGFKGGKGISVGAAIGLMIDWRVFVCIIATFLIVAFLTKKVSLGSICAAVAITIFSLVFHVSTPRLILVICAMCLAIFQHRTNIDRLSKGTEPDFKAADSKTKK